MKRHFLLRRLFIQIVLIFCTIPLHANLLCREVVAEHTMAATFKSINPITQDQPILGNFHSMAGNNKTVVTQCGGTCYFESAISVVESRLSQHLGGPVFISRPHLYVYVLKQKLSFLSKGSARSPFHAQNANIDDKENGITSLMSGGRNFIMTRAFNRNPLPLVKKKSQSDLYRENLVIKKIREKIELMFYEMVHANRPTMTNQEQSHIYMEKKLEESLPLFFNEMDRFLLPSAWKQVYFEPNLELKPTEKPFFLQKDVDGYTHFDADTEKYMENRLKSGGELVLQYFHIHSYVKRKNGRNGFLELPTNPDLVLAAKELDRKQADEHAVAVTDVLRGTDGRIQHLVVRNSWGAGQGDRGYFYISTEYLKQYEDFLGLWDWEVKPIESDRSQN